MILKKKGDTCRTESLWFTNPTHIAGVRNSGPNFKARFGLRNLYVDCWEQETTEKEKFGAD